MIIERMINLKSKNSITKEVVYEKLNTLFADKFYFLEDNFKDTKLRLKKIILNEYQEIRYINTTSWTDLYYYLELLEDKLQLNKDKTQYFYSKEAEYIYYLVELSGEEQVNKLGIKQIYYKEKDFAKKWRNEIAKIIHPDKTSHPSAAQAIEILNNIYAKMVK